MFYVLSSVIVFRGLKLARHLFLLVACVQIYMKHGECRFGNFGHEVQEWKYDEKLSPGESPLAVLVSFGTSKQVIFWTWRFVDILSVWCFKLFCTRHLEKTLGKSMGFSHSKNFHILAIFQPSMSSGFRVHRKDGPGRVNLTKSQRPILLGQKTGKWSESLQKARNFFTTI